MLNDAIRKRGDLKVEVVAVLNDTTGTLVQGAFLDKKCAIGLILGTGSNACYIERVERVLNWDESPAPKGAKEVNWDLRIFNFLAINHSSSLIIIIYDLFPQVIVDVEYGAFGDNGILDFIKTDYDKAVDSNSLLVNSFTFEKYISGKYLGEIARVILMKLVQNGILFDGRASPKLAKSGEFNARFVSMIEE